MESHPRWTFLLMGARSDAWDQMTRRSILAHQLAQNFGYVLQISFILTQESCIFNSKIDGGSFMVWESANHSEQGRSTTSSHERSIRFPRPYHHLTSNSKLYPISHLKPTGTYSGQLTLPPRIYGPNFSYFMSFWTERWWRKLCSTEAGKIQTML
jgi:hypothetical protein